MLRDRTKAQFFWPAVGCIAALDIVSKYLAHTRLVRSQLPHDLIGDVVRITLTYNPGAAFGLHFGTASRWIFLALAGVALVVLWRLYQETPVFGRLRATALGMICGGAVGNVINRLWSPLGVVDFIDMGVGAWRWPTFNVADMGITVGAVLFAWTLWTEERLRSSARRAEGES